VIKNYEDYQFHLIYQELHTFCSVQLGAFYLDVLKDRVYTLRKDGPARRSGQSAMYHVAEDMVRWMAPILSFTAYEIWRYLPKRTNSSPLFETWYTGLAPLPTDSLVSAAQWNTLLALRESVNQALEPLRKDKRIGSGLDAEVDVYTTGSSLTGLADAYKELRFLNLVSAMRIHTTPAPEGAVVSGDVSLIVSVSATTKCARCWHHQADVGANPGHPELCGRCVENVDGVGEDRRWF